MISRKLYGNGRIIVITDWNNDQQLLYNYYISNQRLKFYVMVPENTLDILTNIVHINQINSFYSL